MNKGMTLKFQSLDEDHVLAKIYWREQDIGDGTLMIELTVRNMKAAPKTEEELS